MRSLEQKLIKLELKQRNEEGCRTEEIASRIAAALERNASTTDFKGLYEELVNLPIEPSFPYTEPSTLEAIQAERPDAPRELGVTSDDDEIYNRIYGGWLGRAAGCALGKPVEGWPKHRIDTFLRETNSLQLDNYLPFSDTYMSGVHKPSTRGNIRYMDRDDDMDYPILGLMALERYGPKLTPRSMASIWIANMSYGAVYTAEKAAYRNFVMSIWPPESASYRNPYREWIGAQIRADIFGYVAVGKPQLAAELAFRDASISHEKNGIYGEMFVAAMIAAAFVYSKSEDIITAGLGEIPAQSRLAECVRNTFSWCQHEKNWENVWVKINEHYGHYHGVHTINNAALIVMGLYYGEKDFEKGIVYTVRGGWDTDCTGATVGSILGIKDGAKSLPGKWVGVFNDRLLSAVGGENDNKISDLAQRTFAISRKIDSPPEKTSKAKLKGPAEGSWELQSAWGTQLLNFSQAIIEFTDMGSYATEDIPDPSKLASSSYNHPELKFSFAIDKGGWDYEVDFEGEIDDDTLEGFFYPGAQPVSGVRVSKDQEKQE